MFHRYMIDELSASATHALCGQERDTVGHDPIVPAMPENRLVI